MFIGEYTNRIDEKSRLAIPAKFRPGLQNGAVITKGLDGCLFVYSNSEWAKIAERLTTLPLTAANARAFSRQLLAGAVDVTLDKQGRITLPAYLRDFAGLGTDVVVAGLYNRLEVWAETTWREYQAKSEAEAAAIAEQIMF